jgi:3-deoxy-D-manno-octulosonic-acid transferase
MSLQKVGKRLLKQFQNQKLFYVFRHIEKPKAHL